jgi:hypothetical protein
MTATGRTGLAPAAATGERQNGQVLPRLLPGVNALAAVRQVQDALNDLHNRQSQEVSVLGRFNAYQHWANTHARTLSYYLTGPSLESLVLTAGYDRLQRIDPAGHGALAALIDLEVHQRATALEAALTQLRAVTEAWADVDAVVVPDTSVLLHHEHDLQRIDWRLVAGNPAFMIDVVLLTVVISELDRIKDGRRGTPAGTRREDGNTAEDREAAEDTRTRARRTLRIIEAVFSDPTAVLKLAPTSGSELPVRYRLYLDGLEHRPLPVADAELIDRAVEIRDFSGAKVTVATFDTGMRLRARGQGLRSVSPSVMATP